MVQHKFLDISAKPFLPSINHEPFNVRKSSQLFVYCKLQTQAISVVPCPLYSVRDIQQSILLLRTIHARLDEITKKSISQNMQRSPKCERRAECARYVIVTL